MAMTSTTAFSIMLLCLGAACPLGSTPVLDNKAHRSRNTDAQTDEKKKRPADAQINIEVKVSKEGMLSLPAGSKIELKGEEESCKDLKRGPKPIKSDGTTFEKLPKCKIRLTIFIDDGSDSQIVKTDLRDHNGTVQIRVKVRGDPEVNWSPTPDQ